METVTRIRRVASGADAHGNPTYGDVETAVDGALFAPEQASYETVEVGREAVITKPALYFPGSWPDITARDRVRVRGVEYAVDGTPADWRGFTGFGGLALTLRRVDG